MVGAGETEIERGQAQQTREKDKTEEKQRKQRCVERRREKESTVENDEVEILEIKRERESYGI